MSERKDLSSVEWLHLGSTDEYAALKKDIAHICHDVTHAACIDEICIHDIVSTFKKHGFVVVRERMDFLSLPLNERRKILRRQAAKLLKAMPDYGKDLLE